MKTIPQFQIVSYRFALNPKKLTELSKKDRESVKSAIENSNSKSKRIRDIEKHLKKTSDVDLRSLKKTWKLRGSNLNYKMADHIPIGSLDLPTALSIRLKVILGSERIPGTTSLTLGKSEEAKQRQQQKSKALKQDQKKLKQKSKQRDAIYKEYRTLMRGLGMNLMYDIYALYREFKKPVSETVGVKLRGDKPPQWLYDRLDEYRLKYMIPGHIPRVWAGDQDATVPPKPKGGELIDKRNGPPPERMYKYELVLERPGLVQDYGWKKDVHLDVTKAYKKFKKDRNDENWKLVIKDFIDLYSAGPNDRIYLKTTTTNTDYYYNTYAPKYEELLSWKGYIGSFPAIRMADYDNMLSTIIGPSETTYEQYRDELLRRFRLVNELKRVTIYDVYNYLKEEEKETLEKWSKQKKWEDAVKRFGPRRARLLLKKEVKNYITKNTLAMNLEFARRGWARKGWTRDYSDEYVETITMAVKCFNAAVDPVPKMIFWDMSQALLFLIGYSNKRVNWELRHSEASSCGAPQSWFPENVDTRFYGKLISNSAVWSLERKLRSIYDKHLKGKKDIDWYDYNIVGDTLYFVVTFKDRVLVFTFQFHREGLSKFTYKTSSRKRTPASIKRAIELLEKK